MHFSKNIKWQSQLEKITPIASSLFPVLILGPSGSGKELIAEQIHTQSEVSGKLIKVNCSALTETLIESELFGHKRGSFTGATEDRKGAFEAARGGTLFLDEIGDLPQGLQAKLLRALENNEIKPVGSDTVRKIDVRIIAATHQKLWQRVEEKKFRADLYYRLNVIAIQVPPLRERLEDFEGLFFYFARKYRVNATPAAIRQLKSYHWPGNIRELRNAIARASVLFGREQVTEDAVPSLIRSTDAAHYHHGTFKQFERDLILTTLKRNQGNQRRTAASLGIPKSTLHDRLKTYGVEARTYRQEA